MQPTARNILHYEIRFRFVTPCFLAFNVFLNNKCVVRLWAQLIYIRILVCISIPRKSASLRNTRKMGMKLSYVLFWTLVDVDTVILTGSHYKNLVEKKLINLIRSCSDHTTRCIVKSTDLMKTFHKKIIIGSAKTIYFDRSLNSRWLVTIPAGHSWYYSKSVQ